jgi:hypothetical protein
MGISAVGPRSQPLVWPEFFSPAEQAKPVSNKSSVFQPVQIVPLHQFDTISSMATASPAISTHAYRDTQIRSASSQNQVSALQQKPEAYAIQNRDTQSSIRSTSSQNHVSALHPKPEAYALHGRDSELDKLAKEIRANQYQQHLLGHSSLF